MMMISIVSRFLRLNDYGDNVRYAGRDDAFARIENFTRNESVINKTLGFGDA